MSHPQPTNPLPRSLRAELADMAERYAEADERLRRATTFADRDRAEQERLEAAGQHHALAVRLADLYLLLIRHALEYRLDALRFYLSDALAGEIRPLADAIVALENRVTQLEKRR